MVLDVYLATLSQVIRAPDRSYASADHLCGHGSFATAVADSRSLILIVVLSVVGMLGRWHPVLVTWPVLVGQINTLTGSSVLAALRKRARALRQARLHSSVLGDPVGERILAVLNDGLAGFISIVCVASLAWCDWGIVHKFEQMLAVACDDRKLLAMLAQSIELVGESGLELLTSNVRQLSLSDQRLSLGADEFLLEDNNLWGVWLLVLQLSDLVGDFLLPCGDVNSAPLSCYAPVRGMTYCLCWAARTPQCCECSSW